MKTACSVIPSLLSANFLSLQKDLDEIFSIGIKKLHYDVMDGHFVNNISFGEEILKTIVKENKDKFDIDVHLMVSNPHKKLLDFSKVDFINKISIHFEVLNSKHNDDKSLLFSTNSNIDSKFKFNKSLFKKNILKLQETRSQIKKESKKDVLIGLAINPCTDIKEVVPYIPYFDYFLIMSVVPGKGGQSFIKGSENKIKFLDNYRKEHNLNYFIEVDGGINDVTGKLCLDNGVDYLVCGSFFFKSENKKELVRNMIQ